MTLMSTHDLSEVKNILLASADAVFYPVPATKLLFVIPVYVRNKDVPAGTAVTAIIRHVVAETTTGLLIAVTTVRAGIIYPHVNVSSE